MAKDVVYFDLDRHPDARVALTVGGERREISRDELATLLRDLGPQRPARPQAAAPAVAPRAAQDVTAIFAIAAAIAGRGHLRSADELQLLEALELFSGELREPTDPQVGRCLRAIQSLRVSGTMRHRIDEFLADYPALEPEPS